MAAMAVLALRTIRLEHPHGQLRTLVLWIVVIAAGAWITGRVSTGRGTPFGDFDKAYYPAGRAALANPDALYDCGHADGLCFVNMPVVALAFVPLGELPLAAAHRVMTIVGIASVALAILLLVTLLRASGPDRYAIATVVVLNGPLYYSLRLANLTHVVFVLLLAALLAMRSRHDRIGGILLAICALVKPPFMLWLPYLALRRQTWRSATWFVVAIGAAGVVSLLWFGVGPHRTWLDEYVSGPSTRPSGAYNAQSISGMLIRLTTTAYLVNWNGVEMSSGLRVASMALTLIVFVTLAAVLWGTDAPRSTVDRIAEASLVICAMLLASPISWTHYYLLLLLPISALVTGRFDAGGGVLRSALRTGSVLVMLPVTLWIPSHPILGPVVARLLLSHYVAGAGVLLFALAAWRLREPSTIIDTASQTDCDSALVPRWNADAI